MTAGVFGLAMGQAMRNWWFGVRMAGLAFAAVVLGPLIIAVYGKSPAAFEPSVYIANVVFWMWMLRSRRTVPPA